MKTSTLYYLLEQQARQAPQSVAILAPECASLTFGRLFGQVGEVAAALNALGIQRHDRVAIVLPNGPEMATAFLSIACSAVAAPLNPAYAAAEYEFYLSDLDAKALIVQAGVDSPARAVARDRGIPVVELVPKRDEAAGLFELRGSSPSPAASPNFTPPSLPSPDDIALVLHTSGTTSRPKMVPLSHANLCASAQHIRESLELTSSDRCLNIMPLFHIHGLVAAVLASLAAGGSVVATPGFDAPRFFEWMSEFQPTWYTAVPTMHGAIAARSAQLSQPSDGGRLRFIRSCSSALPPPLMAELERIFRVPVVEAYGMTEAAHQMACNPLPPLQRKPGSVGVATGTQVAVMIVDSPQILANGEAGEIVVRGPNVMPGYLNQPPGAGFTDGWFRTGDVGRIDAEGYVFLEGRIKEIINRGGEKISPREVEEVLLQHPAVAQALVFALPDSSLGQDVGAAVVLRDPAVTEKQLRQAVAARLASFKVPRRIVVLDALPLGPTGKPQRIGMAERLGLNVPVDAVPAPAAESVAPRTPEEEFLAEIWCEVLRLPSVGVHDRFLDLGGDSLLAARTLARVNHRLDVDLDLLDFLDAPTIADQAAMLAEKLG